MKRTLVAMLLAGILGAIAIVPTLAASHMPAADMCPHDPTVASLLTCVEHMEQNDVIDNDGVATSLSAKLNAAQAADQRGQQDVATRQLKAMIQQITAQAGKHIAQPHANHLIQHTELVIAALDQ